MMLYTILFLFKLAKSTMKISSMSNNLNSQVLNHPQQMSNAQVVIFS